MIAVPTVRTCERVLILNDNEDMLTTMQDILEAEGALVRTATSGERALEILDQGFAPSVVVSDVRLGSGERGDQFVRRLRSHPKYARVPVILMSGDIHELRRLGNEADAKVGKPFDVEHLLELLSEICAEHREADQRPHSSA